VAVAVAHRLAVAGWRCECVARISGCRLVLKWCDLEVY
jgi:hypothetical protein